jgi:hypothetical protein
MPKRGEISDDTPLRLAVAAALAYPDGSMTAFGAVNGRPIERTRQGLGPGLAIDLRDGDSG